MYAIRECFCNNDPAVLEFCKGKYVHNENLKFKDMKDGEIIELGQITLEAIWEFNAWQRCTDYEECLQAYEKFQG